MILPEFEKRGQKWMGSFWRLGLNLPKALGGLGRSGADGGLKQGAGRGLRFALLELK